MIYKNSNDRNVNIMDKFPSDTIIIHKTYIKTTLHFPLPRKKGINL